MSRRILGSVRDWFFNFYENRLHFIELHYLWFAFCIFFTSALFYCEPGTTWNYVDALFMATTSFTNTGLNTLAMSDLSIWQTTIIVLNCFFSSHIIVSYVVLMARKHYFSKRFEDILRFNKERRAREENRRKERKRRMSARSKEGGDGDLELGIKSADSPSLHRRSLSSIASTPVPGVQACKGRGRAISAIPGLSQDLRKEKSETADLTTKADMMSQFGVEKAKENHPSGYPCETKFDPTADKSGVTTPQSPSSDSATQPAVLGNPAGGIAFANNVEQQRENARRQFEQGRRFDGMVDMMSRDNDMPLTDTVLDSDMDDDSRDDEAMFEEIMRQPIDKSQLTNEQKYLLGGVEYRALDMLSRIVPIYFLCMNIISAFFFRLYVACSPYAQNVLLTSNPNPVDPWFWSFFASISSFNNLGLIQLDANMSPFQSSPAPLILSAFLIVVGNTGYAIVLRFIIWVLYKLTPHDNTYRRETLRFLLDHPRRCYTTLFPATQTWWLFIILLVINIVEIVSFLVLNFWLPVLENLSWGTRVLIAFFQSVATRNAGFTVINLNDINPGAQLVYIIAMYISAYPVAISMRNTNVYQERSLGVYRGSQNDGVAFTDSELRGPAPFIKLRRHPTINSVVTQSRKLLRGPDFFVLTQIQRQLTSDICWVITGVFCICVIEARAIMSPSPITISTVIYEAVSAFGNVGASPGYPNTATSQCGQYHLLGKLVLILLMYRGRHRGLPSSIDRAVLLPSEQLEQQEVEEQLLKRRNTSLTNQSSFHNAMLYTRSSTL